MDLSKFTTDGKFLMLALDQRGSFQKMLNPVTPQTVDDRDMIMAKKEIIDVLYDLFSSILIDPHFGIPAYKEKTKPYLLCIEKSGYIEKDGERNTEIAYTVEELKEMGAAAIKLNLQFSVDSSSTQDQLELAKKTLDESHGIGLPLFLEIIVYKGTVVDAVQKFVDNQIVPDVFKLQYPGSVVDCERITKMLGETPWILLTEGENFDLFKNQLAIAVLHGAAGFLAGRSIWQEFGQYHDQEERKIFLTTVAAQRFREIADIVAKNAFIA